MKFKMHKVCMSILISMNNKNIVSMNTYVSAVNHMIIETSEFYVSKTSIEI